MANEGAAQPLHVFLVSFAAQGFISPTLRLGKLLASKGLLVTFITTQDFRKLLEKQNDISTDHPLQFGTGSLRFEFFSDGLPDEGTNRLDVNSYLPVLEQALREKLPLIVKSQPDNGRPPVSCIVNNPFIPWVCDIAEELAVPCATLWVQACGVFATYYHYLHKLVPFPTDDEPEIEIKIPGLPVLKADELPSFLQPRRPEKFKVLGKIMLAQFERLPKSFCVLTDGFEALEKDTHGVLSKFCKLRPIGPLFKGTKTLPAATGDVAVDCIKWLDSRPSSSVVYISFGTIVHLSQQQVDELAYGVLNSGVSFLWVMRPARKDFGQTPVDFPEGFLDKVGDKGKVVDWAPQLQVLGHPAVKCFFTHCGWNSSVETLSFGVPVVCFPHVGDQIMNCKFLVDVFGIGVRLWRGEPGKVVPRDDVKKCLLEATVGEKASELKKNALKWKKAAEAAVAEGGSSDRNIDEFVEEVRARSSAIRSAS